ncbi:hypothetical protein [Mesobacillus foraminis]|uniref:Uncharacterized protein n=1 Tax=Mesobacillus foraminis TaxID=279826 RepID=A0A4R2BF27_9BACI|nr:hypothetical protein [Mesobacillus foraminis]TCN25063.1 hypothetical protein EV146_106266 [Mesobacillus foraminis]
MNIRKLVLLLMIVTLSGIAYGAYFFGTKLASDKLVTTVAKEIEKSGELEEFKRNLEEDPELQKMLAEADASANDGNINAASAEENPPASVQDETPEKPAGTELNDKSQKDGQASKKELPFTTKEEATKVLIKKVGITKLQEMHTQVQEGSATNEEILKEVKKNLSEEEILALKVIAYKELSGK